MCSIVCFTIYIHFEKRRSYQKGLSDGVKHYSGMVDEVLHRTNQWNKEAKEAGRHFTAHIESIEPLKDALVNPDGTPMIYETEKEVEE